MELNLTPIEQRIIGCLLEKQQTTPDQYPLSLNSLTNACNQKSNREPVMALSESDVQEGLDSLVAKRLVTVDEGLSGRVSKYAHRFCNTEFGSIKLTDQQKAIVCLMLVRGAQTPGELRTRSNRLAEFSNVTEVESALNALVEQEYVVKLEREPGKRESRFMHLFGDDDISELTAVNSNAQSTVVASHQSDEVAQLRLEVAELRSELAEIKSHLGL
ncbi:YceH family protein [Pseudoalteromonas sp. G4]|uniref:YceH family protein n=1 Tax=Pseudoalteromonas sp. G4 TaxID=2992761 RepID=UPI00406D0613